MTNVPWITTTIDLYVDEKVGAEKVMSCTEHAVGRHTLVGRKLSTEGERTECQQQWFCHRCAKEMSAMMSKQDAIEMMVETNARMGQG